MTHKSTDVHDNIKVANKTSLITATLAALAMNALEMGLETRAAQAAAQDDFTGSKKALLAIPPLDRRLTADTTFVWPR